MVVRGVVPEIVVIDGGQDRFRTVNPKTSIANDNIVFDDGCGRIEQ